MEFVCNECGVLFTQKQSLLRHVRTVHQGMKRTDNEKRKREVTDKAGKQGILKRSEIRPFGEPVESIPQAVFKRPAEYVATVIITVLHLQFCITVIITVLDYSLHLQFCITVIITVSDYSDYSDYYSDCLH